MRTTPKYRLNLSHTSGSGSYRLTPTSRDEKMKNLLLKLWKDEEGAEVVEWALVVGLVVIGAIAGYSLLGNTIETAVNKVASSLSSAVS